MGDKQIKTFNVIGQGAYGCALKPSPPCMASQNSDHQAFDVQDKIAKVMSSFYAKQELAQTEIIDKIDSDFKYHLPKPVSCTPDLRGANIEVLNKCKVIDIKNRMQHDSEHAFGITQLVYEYGGETWKDFSSKYNLQPPDIKHFLISAYNIVCGVQDMLKNGYIHGDLKFDNILYDVKKNRCNMIDFGGSNFISYFFNVERRVTESNINYWWPHTCPEKKFQYKRDYDFQKRFFNLEPNNFDLCVRYMSLSEGGATYTRYMYVEERKAFFKKDIIGLFEYIRDSEYDTFLKETFNLLDSYFVGFSLVVITYNLMENSEDVLKEDHDCFKLVSDIRNLAIQASRIDPRHRLSAIDFVLGYKKCIDDYENKIASSTRSPVSDSKNEMSTADRIINSESRLKEKFGEIVIKYEDILILDLVDFTKGDNYKKLHDLELQDIDIRHFFHSQERESDAQAKQLKYMKGLKELYIYDYIMLLKKLHSPITIAFFDDSHTLVDEHGDLEDNIRSRCVYIDSVRLDVYIILKQQKKATSLNVVLYFPQSTQNQSKIPNTKRIIISNFNSEKTDKFNPLLFDLYELPFLVESVCTFLIDFDASLKTLASILEIICVHPNDSMVISASRQTHYFERTFSEMLGNVIKNGFLNDETAFFEAYYKRMILLLMREKMK